MRKWVLRLVVPVLLVVWLATYSMWWEPASFVVRQVELKGLPGWSLPLRVAALSDLHIGSMHVGPDKLDHVVQRTNAERPDIVVIMGDFINGGLNQKEVKDVRFVSPERIAAGLAKLRAPLGVFAVLGNHDRWFDGPRVEQALRAVGIHVMENHAERIVKDSGAFWLGGVSDLWTAAPDIAGTLAQTDAREPVILFTHNPDIFPDVPARVSLLIAGHTHGGQVELPWVGPPITVSRYRKGHIVEDGRHLFVTTGVGTSIAPIRFRVTPELVMLSLAH